MQILVVDDEPEIREVLCEALRMWGHETAACGDAEAAIAMLPYADAVICDGMHGRCWPVVDEAVCLGRGIVLFTGDPGVQQEAALVGVPCVGKPGGVVELLAALDGALVEAVR